MTRALFLDILKHNLIGPLIFIMVVYLFYWCLMLTLGCRILNIKINLLILSPSIFIMLCYCIVVRWYIHPAAYGIVLAVLIAILLKINGGSACSIPRALWTSMSIMLISGLGDTFVLFPAYLNKNAANYLIQTPVGNALSGLLETVFPLLAFIALPRLKKISLLLPLKNSNRSNRYELYIVATYCLMYIALYLAMLVVYISALHHAKDIILYLILLWILMIGIILCYHVVVRYLNKRDELKQKLLEAEQEKTKQLNIAINELKTMKMDKEKMDTVSSAIEQLLDYKRLTAAKVKFDFILEKLINDEIKFTETDLKILDLILEGKSNREIGEIIHLSEGRVGNRISDMLAKTGLADRAALAVYYTIKIIFTNKE